MFFKRPSVLMSKQWALVCVADDTTESSRGAGRSLSKARGTFIRRFAPADEHAAITYDLAPVAVQRPRAFRSTLIPLFRRDSATVPLRGCRLRTLSWWLSCRRSWRGVDWLSRVHTAPRSYTAQDGDNPRSRRATAMVSTPNGTVVRYVLMGFLFSAELRSELVCVCGTCSHD